MTRKLMTIGLLAVCACEANTPDDVVPTGKTAEPAAVVVLDNGNELRFFAEPTQGTAFLEVGNVANGGPVSRRPELVDATPADVFWAVSKAGTPVPAALATAEHTQPQGWLVTKMGPVLSTPEQCTSDVVFDDTFCEEPAPYDSHKCFFNRTAGTTIWNSANMTSRYKAGICVQSGTLHDQLIYHHHTPEGACGFAFPGDVFAYSLDLGPGGFAIWTWHGGSDDWWRDWSHQTTGGGDAVFDHGQRWNTETECK
jgi:hypothetical protein